MYEQRIKFENILLEHDNIKSTGTKQHTDFYRQKNGRSVDQLTDVSHSPY